jgi:hypothetical protein
MFNATGQDNVERKVLSSAHAHDAPRRPCHEAVGRCGRACQRPARRRCISRKRQTGSGYRETKCVGAQKSENTEHVLTCSQRNTRNTPTRERSSTIYIKLPTYHTLRHLTPTTLRTHSAPTIQHLRCLRSSSSLSSASSHTTAFSPASLTLPARQPRARQ